MSDQKLKALLVEETRKNKKTDAIHQLANLAANELREIGFTLTSPVYTIDHVHSQARIDWETESSKYHAEFFFHAGLRSNLSKAPRKVLLPFNLETVVRVLDKEYKYHPKYVEFGSGNEIRQRVDIIIGHDEENNVWVWLEPKI